MTIMYTYTYNNNKAEVTLKNVKIAREIYREYTAFLTTSRDMCSKVWAQFSMPSIIVGVVLLGTCSICSLFVFVYLMVLVFYESENENEITNNSHTDSKNNNNDNSNNSNSSNSSNNR